MRRLDDKFIDDLNSGILTPLLEVVKSDTSLCLELRGNSINVYYRGGSLMKIARKNQSYSASFDVKYFRSEKRVCPTKQKILNQKQAEQWLEMSPVFKHAMDRYFGRRRWDEREIQQLIVRDNNFGTIARSTDYYICDIEYVSEKRRFDMIGVHWPSTSAARKKSNGRRLILVEVKHGDSSLEGKAGLDKHIRDINSYLSDSDNLENLKKDMRDVFNQKRNLGLIECEENLDGFSDETPYLLLALANHDPEKSKLAKLLRDIPDSPHIDLRIATASFLGYGLYDQGIHTIEKAKELFSEYIYSRNNPKAS